MFELMQIVAQAAAPGEGGPPPPGKGGPGAWTSFMPIILLVVIFYFFLSRGRQKDQKKRKNRLATMKKNDRVMTIGGVIGTVVVIKDDEVTLKVDETANVKMTFTRGSIQKVVSESGSS